jgi:lipopolysaccharide/colanic/teichoic acid biosynthesis glycosyltransferase
MTSINKSPKIFIRKAISLLVDKAGAILGLAVTGILFPIIFASIKHGSKGPVIYKQTRLGKNGVPFTLYKFRTMIHSAEENGPELSHSKDNRITKAGFFLRYFHLDELPQFWNIIKGDMSIVGPRPERPFFAEKIKHETPEYQNLLTVKPGLTSLGMIQYGYASSIEEMKERVKYDLIYLEDPNHFKDLKLILDTVIYLIKKLAKSIPDLGNPLSRSKKKYNKNLHITQTKAS